MPAVSCDLHGDGCPNPRMHLNLLQALGETEGALAEEAKEALAVC
jgi:hypothetical protein